MHFFVLHRVYDDGIRYRGRTFTERDVTDVRALIVRYPDKSRFFLSKSMPSVELDSTTYAKDMVWPGLIAQTP